MSSQKTTGIASTAAYLLFYRRRSSQPLGSPELQELVNKSRSKEPADSSDAEDSSSGEGVRLDDRSSASLRLPGSSSAGTVAAGAANGTRLRGGDDGLGNAANQAARLRETSEDGDEGYQSSPGQGFLTNQSSSWGFSNLGDTDDVDASMDSTNTPADTASDRPDAGSDGGETLDQRLLDFAGDDDYNDGGDYNNDTTDENDGIFGDSYEDAQEHDGGMEILSAEKADPPVRDINLDQD